MELGASIKLYDSAASPFAQKVRIFLRERGLPFESISFPTLGSGQPIPELEAYNPRLEVPTLVHSPPGAADVVVAESSIILQYLEAAIPQNALLANISAADLARARMLEHMVDTTFEPINWGHGEIVWGKRAEGRLREKILEGARKDMVILQSWLEEKLDSRPYFHGDGMSFGFADLVIAPMVHRSFYVGLLRKDSDLSRWHDRIQERSSVKITFREFEDAFKVLADKLSTFTSRSNQSESAQLRRLYRDHRLEWLIKQGGLESVQDGIVRNNIRFGWPSNS